MDIVQLGAQLLSEKLGLQIDTDTVASSLSALLGDGQGNIDLAGLASRMMSSGELSSVLGSWLGDGANGAISAESILGVLGESSVADFASSLGTDTGSAASGPSRRYRASADCNSGRRLSAASSAAAAVSSDAATSSTPSNSRGFTAGWRSLA